MTFFFFLNLLYEAVNYLEVPATRISPAHAISEEINSQEESNERTSWILNYPSLHSNCHFQLHRDLPWLRFKFADLQQQFHMQCQAQCHSWSTDLTPLCLPTPYHSISPLDPLAEPPVRPWHTLDDVYWSTTNCICTAGRETCFRVKKLTGLARNLPKLFLSFKLSHKIAACTEDIHFYYHILNELKWLWTDIRLLWPTWLLWLLWPMWECTWFAIDFKFSCPFSQNNFRKAFRWFHKMEVPWRICFSEQNKSVQIFESSF